MTDYSLKDFATLFKSKSDPSISDLWTFSEFETPQGMRQEMRFATGHVVLMLLPSHTWELLVVPTTAPRIYEHARYVLESLFYDWSARVGDPLHIGLKGLAYQSVLPLQAQKGIKITVHEALGTVNQRTRKYVEAITMEYA